MYTRLWFFGIILFFSLSQFQIYGQEESGTEQKFPPARKIPGITTDDPYPNGCVDCHINYPEMNMDTRFSTLMKLWRVRVDSLLMEKVKDSAPEGMILKGKHPNAPASFNNIPGDCMICHSKKSKTVPPFAKMIHKIHLTGGEENPFLTLFQGECTYCHKLNLSNGSWMMPSASEH
jgi:hypothetical protein